MSDVEGQVESALSENGSKVVELTRSLIKIPTVNPPGDETTLAEFIASWFDKAGLECRIITKQKNRPNVEARLEGEAQRPSGPAASKKPPATLIMNAHMDVVPVSEGWTHPPFDAVVEDGRVYGRGSSDTKGGMAAMMVALETLKSRGRDKFSGTIVLYCVADEEVGGIYGTEFIAREGHLPPDAHFAIIAEPTDLAVCTAHKGGLTFELTTKGKAAHASLPAEGHSAIFDMNKILTAYAAYSKEIQKVKNQFLGSPTVNVGVIMGGVKSNVIPDRCWIAAERRVVPPEDLAQVKAEMLSVFSRLKESDPGLDYDIKFVVEVGASEVPEENAGVQTALSVLGDLQADIQSGAPAPSLAAGRSGEGQASDGGRESMVPPRPRAVGFTATCDAYFLTNIAKIPTIICGPGSLNKAHTRDEFVEVEQLRMATKMYALTALRYLDRPGGRE